MSEQLTLSFFMRPLKLPVLVMEPGPIRAAASFKCLAQVLTEVVGGNPGVQTIFLAGGDGAAFAYHVGNGIVAREFGPRHFWTKRHIVDAYNARCTVLSDRYAYSLANRKIERVVADVVALLSHARCRSVRAPRAKPTLRTGEQEKEPP